MERLGAVTVVDEQILWPRFADIGDCEPCLGDQPGVCFQRVEPLYRGGW
ncbi:Uncharacterised protein [Mycobacteroides abscessus subsp. massiliense]|nr:Uncharacterised protein [Mycobacteroides abscessus subsp. massiliense]